MGLLSLAGTVLGVPDAENLKIHPCIFPVDIGIDSFFGVATRLIPSARFGV
ncbi:hypothetical protein vfu_A01368 [Vibrio furnissii NCTC 11218]|nr:hypothetical protein vfu_A01368 [Vibrio furnissii NCTC 11218]